LDKASVMPQNWHLANDGAVMMVPENLMGSVDEVK
jgi:hypothetical protein